jgi:CheY-like chemotaxis protein/two-component sensor histidine kinase
MSGHLDEANEKWLKKAEISCARAAELVRGLLTFSRKKEVQLQSVDLNMEIRNSVAMLERTLPKTLQIELALSEKLLCLKGDPVQLEHILLNLASNANDATGGKGKIRIATESLRIDSPEKHWGIPPGDYLHLCVSDNGEGMDENTLRNLFNPFFTTKEVGKGTGLGLAIVYGLVKGHGGHIVCRSRKGEGTIFDLYFPATDECPEASFYASAPERLADDEGVRMLLVDDNHAVLETTGHAFEAMGFKVFQAACGEDALDLYREKRDEIDVVVLDVGMPGMGGIQCFKELRKIYPRCKVVFATGYCLPAIPRDEAGRPADAMLQKPYRIAELLKVIQEITKRGAA